jgi:hypothetical protein
MRTPANRETVNDTAKLIMHRLIARELARDPTLVERLWMAARIRAKMAERPGDARVDVGLGLGRYHRRRLHVSEVLVFGQGGGRYFMGRIRRDNVFERPVCFFLPSPSLAARQAPIRRLTACEEESAAD